MKYYNLIISIFLFSAILPAFGFEDCIINADGKLTNIEIKDKNIIEISPLVTILNEKNTLILHPLKIGKTSFSVIKNNEKKITFYVEVSEENTTVSEQEGCEILTLDTPPEILKFDLDTPPVKSIPKLRGKN